MKRRFLFCCLIFFGILSDLIPLKAQNPDSPVAQLVNQFKQLNPQLPKRELFHLSTVQNNKPLEVLKSFTAVTLDGTQLSQLMTIREGGIELTVPFRDSYIELELVQVNLLTDDFRVLTDQSDNTGVSYTPGIFYRGIVKNNNHSLAAFSFFDHELAGIISTDDGNIVVGKLHNGDPNTTDYIVYSDRDFLSPHLNTCATYEDPDYAQQLLQNIQSGSTVRTNNCVRLYYELDNNVYQSSGGSISDATNWLLSVHNNVAALYANDGITVALSEVFLWTFPDPYHFSSSTSQLYNFKIFRTSFNGDIGQLVSIDPGMLGGIASVVNALCNPGDKYCYSDVDYEFGTVPEYSWTVNVITHEFGHLMGSYHTHNCIWPGGAIDDCGPLAGFANEGNCPLGPNPVNGGTIMSYCHLTGFGVNFNNGFGPLPAEAIRGAVDGASCLTASCIPNPSSYCKSHGKTTGEWIQSVKINGFNNNSGAGPGYSNFTDKVIVLHPGSTMAITISPGYSGTEYNEYFSVWIDYNGDLNFYGANENVYKSAPSNVPVTGTFTVPIGITGTTRMRISMKFDTLPTACETFKYGEVEDYSVSFQPEITYCASSGIDASHEWIDKIQLGSISRKSLSDGGYFNGTVTSTNLVLNSTNTITFSAGFAGQKYKEFWKGWIDYDGDGEFEGNEKILDKASQKDGNIIRTFTVPVSALIGKTRFRISMKRHEEPASCETFLYGEVEDYSVIISPQDIAPAPYSVLEISIYPNPAASELIASFKEPLKSGFATIIDITGRTVMTVQVPDDVMSIVLPVQNMSAGIYFLRIKAADRKTAVLKWIKQ